MTDLFSTAPAKVGYGNARFLADLYSDVSIDELRTRTKAGHYPNLWSGCRQWIEFARGRP